MKDAILSSAIICAALFASLAIWQNAKREKVYEQVSTLPLSHPLGCPVEDEQGRQLKATIYVSGERKQRCYYSKATP